MKRIIFSSVMLLLIGGAYAQHVEYGIKGGVNFSNLKDDAADNDADGKTGFYVGGLAHIHITRAFAIQPERSGLGVDARYNLGLTDVTKSNTTDFQNRVWQLGLFYQFKRK